MIRMIRYRLFNISSSDSNLVILRATNTAILGSSVSRTSELVPCWSYLIIPQSPPWHGKSINRWCSQRTKPPFGLGISQLTMSDDNEGVSIFPTSWIHMLYTSLRLLGCASQLVLGTVTDIVTVVRYVLSHDEQVLRYHIADNSSNKSK